MLNKISVVIVAVLLSLAALASVLDIEPAFAATDWWPMFHHDLGHTGYSTSAAPDTNDTLWEYATGGNVYSSPAIVNGKVYVGSGSNKIYCLDAMTGAHIWNYITGGWVESSPAVADGKVYVGSEDSKVYCLNASTGAHVWSYTTGFSVFSSPIVADGKVYVGSWDCKVYCLNASTGALVWSYTTGDVVLSSPAVADGKVYIGSYDGKVYAFGLSQWPSVGGYWVPTGKLQILVPCLGLASTFMTVVAATALCTRHFRRKKEKQ
jgi:PKD repeat protein